MYEASTVPALLPGGGGFSVMQFNLGNLYSMHKLCQNWWTASNEHLPLCKYLGCTLTLYRSETIDYIMAYQRDPPFNSNKLTYPSCQPSMLLMRRNKLIVRSKLNKPNSKPYKKIFIKPPTQFQTKWYFQKDLINQTLLVLHAAPTTLDHYYIATSAENTNVSIVHLNTKSIQNRDFGSNKYKTDDWPFKNEGTQVYYFYRYNGNENHNNTQNFKIIQITPLTEIRQHREGMSPEEAKQTHNINNYTDYKNKIQTLRGNIFHKENFNHMDQIFYTTVSPTVMFNNLTEQKTIGQLEEHSRVFTKYQDNIFTQTRYNPTTDTGESTRMFLLSNNKPAIKWDPPPEQQYNLDGFPLWLNIFGFVDFQKRLQTLIGVDENYMLCFQTNHTNPKYNYTFVPISTSFLENKSPYLSYLTHEDSEKWYPQIQYQTEAINAIGACGPGIVKMEQRKSEEIKVKYDFHFKWGGSPAKMVTIDDPSEQIIYPIPRNEYETTSLQGPAQNYETVVYSFDQRNYQFTKAALERMQKDWTTKGHLFSITEPTREVPVQQTLETLLQETETEEKSEEALLQQLQLHKQQQLLLKQRILEMLSQRQKLE